MPPTAFNVWSIRWAMRQHLPRSPVTQLKGTHAVRKHNTKFATRWSRETGDRSNFPQQAAHGFVNNKFSQFAANSLLQTLFLRAGCLQPAQGFEAPVIAERGPDPEHIVGTIGKDTITTTDKSLVAHLRSALRKFF